MAAEGEREGLPAVFLDRDGVLVASEIRAGVPRPPGDVHELALLPGVEEACRALAAAGFLLVVVSNQPDVARGVLAASAVDRIGGRLQRRLPVAEVVVCLHDDADRCSCRKPRPGMLVDAARRHGIDLGASFMVGDRWRDVEAGRRAGCRVVFVDRGYDEPLRSEPDVVVADLPAAASWILGVSSLGTSRRAQGATR